MQLSTTLNIYCMKMYFVIILTKISVDIFIYRWKKNNISDNLEWREYLRGHVVEARRGVEVGLAGAAPAVPHAVEGALLGWAGRVKFECPHYITSALPVLCTSR